MLFHHGGGTTTTTTPPTGCGVTTFTHGIIYYCARDTNRRHTPHRQRGERILALRQSSSCASGERTVRQVHTDSACIRSVSSRSTVDTNSYSRRKSLSLSSTIYRVEYIRNARDLRTGGRTKHQPGSLND